MPKLKISSLINNFNLEKLLIIFAVLVSKSLYYESFGENKLIILLFILIFIKLLIDVYNKKVFFSKNSIILYLIILIIIYINPNAKMSTSLVFTALITSALCFTNIISLSRFSKVFYSLIKFLMIVSIFRYFFIFTDFQSFLPNFISIEGDNYKNLIFFGILEEKATFISIIRNNGLWWEPGAFQLIINLSFLLGLTFKMISKKDFVLFLIVIITTGSTAGIFIFSLLSIIYFRNSINYKLLFLVLFILFPVIFISSFYEIVIESKINPDNASATSRYNDAVIAIKMFLDYPFFGTGFGDIDILEKYTSQYSYGTGSNGILLLLANLGLLSFVIFIPLFFPGFLIAFKNLIDKIIVSLSLFLIFFTQNFTIVFIFSLMIFYGVKKYKSNNFNHIKIEKDII